MVLLRLEQEGVQALKQFVKDFEHKRSKNNTAWVFPDGEVIHVQDHGVAILKINDWRRDNKQWSGKTAPEIEIVRLGVHENFQTGNGVFCMRKQTNHFHQTYYHLLRMKFQSDRILRMYL